MATLFHFAAAGSPGYQSNPVMASLIGLLLIAAICAMIPFSNWLGRKMTGWQAITEHFPAQDLYGSDQVYKRVPGMIGVFASKGGGVFTATITNAGISLEPKFARHRPAFIAWGCIRQVVVTTFSIHVSVEYEKRFEFFLPLEALPSLKAKIPPEKFQTAPSVQSVLDAAKGALASSSQPALVSRFESAVLSSLEKRVEQEQARRSKPK